MIELTTNRKFQSRLKIFIVYEEIDIKKKLTNYNVKANKSILQDFNATSEQILTFYDNTDLIMLVGLGSEKKLTSDTLTKTFGKLHSQVSKLDIDSPYYIIEGDIEEQIVHIANSNYKFDKYQSESKSEKRSKKKVRGVSKNNSSKNNKNNKNNKKKIIVGVIKKPKNFKNLSIMLESMKLVKDLGNEPGNELNPDSYVQFIKKRASLSNLKVKVLDNAKLKKLGLLSLLSVSNGSKWGGYLVEISLPQKNKGKNICLVGKGITFDSGGISLKPGKNMGEMKSDMLGSATVLGIMDYLANTKSKCNVTGYLAIAENMPGSEATRPGDIIKSYSGKTIEILNTDAEGRLVLADALSYCQKHNKPDIIIDMATLTGQQEAVSCSLFTSIMGNDIELTKKLIESGNQVNERLVEFPLYPEYIEQTKSDIADVKNAEFDCKAGMIQAGAFLSNFIEDEDNKVSWAHLDIAGPAYRKESTGIGVRMISNFIESVKN